MPSQVGDMSLVIQSATGFDVLAAAGDRSRGVYEGMLTSLGKEPEDLRFAFAVPSDESATDAYNVRATHIAGVPAEVTMDVLQEFALTRHGRGAA